MNSLFLLLLYYNFIDYGIAEQEYLTTTYRYEETATMDNNFEDKSSDHNTKNVSLGNTEMILSQKPTNSTSLSVHQIYCGVEQFQCNNNLCISQDKTCDGNNDCGDSSDETECEQKTCSSIFFMCKNSKCIPKQWRCDFNRDCSDGSDEINCDHLTCSENEFTCTNGKCIPILAKCDGHDDCRDGSDENGCANVTCSEREFTCTSEQCIPIHFRCDRDDDCIDGSDERNCELEKNNFCKNDEFQCKTAIFHCLPLTWRCDGTRDCVDGSDENDCNGVCASNHFSCGPPIGRCIYTTWVCDGDKDCPDGRDEVNCTTVMPTAPPNCPVGYFSCDENCYPLALLCDKKLDCKNGYDESNCTKDSPKVYQIQYIEVNENGSNESNLSLHWWIPTSVSLEFMPSISKVDENIWINHTWIDETEYIFTNLEPYTLYNMTIYVKIANTSTVFPPAKYIVAFTDEGIPSEPHDVKVQQHNNSHVFISWHEPVYPNGKIIKYELSWYPPLPPLKLNLNGNETAHYLSYDFQFNITYSFYVTAYNEKYKSHHSQMATFEF